METPDVVEKLGDADFTWGRRRGIGVKDRNCKFYESFTYDGVQYALYDCIYMHKEDEDKPYIGKLIKIWDKPNQPKMVKVQWFFRPTEIWWWLRQLNQKASPNELFFASGEGAGLADTNHLEAIVGKCNVVCISKDKRNLQPSGEQLQGADYVFYRTFDVGKCITSEHFGDKVGDLEVKFVFNRKESQKSDIVKEKAANDLEGQSGRNCVDVVTGEMNGPVRGKNNATADVVNDNEPLKGRSESGQTSVKSIEDPSSLDNRPAKRTKLDGSNVITNSKDLVKDEKKSIGDIFNKPAPSYISAEGKKKTGQMEFIEPKKDVKIVEDSSTLGDGPLRKVKVDEYSPNAKPKRSLESTYGHDVHTKKKSNGNVTMANNLSPKEDINEEKKSKFTIDSPRLGHSSSLTSSFKDKSIEKKDKCVDSFDSKVASEEMLGKKKSAPPNNSTTLVLQASKDAIVEGRVIEVSRRPHDDEGRWFHLPPWEERMLAASDQGMLVFLQNLDPEYTSAEVEDIIWHAFREKCNAKVVQRNAFSNPHIGQALLIFKSREAAERVVRKLNDGCLVLSDQRPLVGRPVNLPKNVGKQSKFAGHLVIDKLKLQLQRDKDAVSTSHCAQPNTIEHELAMEWCLLQSRSDIWWKKLHKQHVADLKRLMGGLKSN